MSDLFCPATLVFARVDSEVDDVIASVRARNLAAIFCPTDSDIGPAQQVSDTFNLDLSQRVELDAPGASETRAAQIHRVRDLVEEVSDLYRGQTVLVFGSAALIHHSVASMALLAPGVSAPEVVADAAAEATTLLEVHVDADGIVCTAWT